MLKPADFITNYSKSGAVKATAPTMKLLLLGISAGFILACALFASMLPDFQTLFSQLPNAGIAVENLCWFIFAEKNLVPVTLGNIAGGVGLGALLWCCHGKKVFD